MYEIPKVYNRQRVFCYLASFHMQKGTLFLYKQGYLCEICQYLPLTLSFKARASHELRRQLSEMDNLD